MNTPPGIRRTAETRVRLVLEYDGTAYSGIQRQSHSPNIQSMLEAALSKVAGAPVAVAVAGRTDSGVHATAQIVSFDPPVADRTCEAWLRGGNTHLPKDIAIVQADTVQAGFHARFSALSRRYLYLVSEASLARRSKARL